jgi:hypothetical protein
MMNGKGLGRKRPWPYLRHYAGIHLERLRKTTQKSITIEEYLDLRGMR